MKKTIPGSVRRITNLSFPLVWGFFFVAFWHLSRPVDLSEVFGWLVVFSFMCLSNLFLSLQTNKQNKTLYRRFNCKGEKKNHSESFTTPSRKQKKKEGKNVAIIMILFKAFCFLASLVGFGFWFGVLFFPVSFTPGLGGRKKPQSF